MDSQCLKCDSFNFPGEATDNEFTSCCNKGTIIIPPLTQLAQDIKNLFIGNIKLIFLLFLYKL
jgi:hypothetical protein